MAILCTLIFIAFLCRNSTYKYVPLNEEIPLFETRVFTPDTLDVSIWLQCYRFYFVLGRNAYSYEHVYSVDIKVKKFIRRPEICIERYQKDIDTHRFLYFYAKHYTRIQQEIEEGQHRSYQASQACLED